MGADSRPTAAVVTHMAYNTGLQNVGRSVAHVHHVLVLATVREGMTEEEEYQANDEAEEGWS